MGLLFIASFYVIPGDFFHFHFYSSSDIKAVSFNSMFNVCWFLSMFMYLGKFMF
jgi:hypothetical protein